ncbi:unknown similar to AMEV003 [Mythimna separata entomopoxvirus 'L']|uniref:Uncharacterized protein n=1 Tax=Mythimna separata entomopoxvirus 'L' TaxID=1293572 RepID=A0A916KPZ2_9POXV|nr:unknown similar to AMEV003 [Mythimna separata entomopoxvirus 'L']CCU56234.1 unknown similar to AMEV003 [Mythimna separata entomopoxvirus 'L']
MYTFIIFLNLYNIHYNICRMTHISIKMNRLITIISLMFILHNTSAYDINTELNLCIKNDYNISCNKINNDINLSYDYDDGRVLKNLSDLIINFKYYINNDIKQNTFINYIMEVIKDITKFNKIVEKDNIKKFNNLIYNLFNAFKTLYVTKDNNFIYDFMYIRELCNKFPVWFINDNEILVTILNMYSYYRNIDYKDMIDNSAIQIIKIALDYPLYYVNEHDIKDIFYIYYIKNIPKNEHYKFKSYYNEINVNNIFPNRQDYMINGTNVNIIIMYDKIDSPDLNIVYNDIYNIYNNFILFNTKINIDVTKLSANIEYMIFNSYTDYLKYASYLNIDVSNTGLTTNISGIKCYSYISSSNKISNFGYQLFNGLSYTLYKNFDSLPKWARIGVSNSYGNHDCEIQNSLYKKNNVFEINDIINQNSNINLESASGALVRYLSDKKPEVLYNLFKYNKNSYKNNNDNIGFNNWIANITEFCTNNYNIYNPLYDDNMIQKKYLYYINKYNIFDNCDGDIFIEYENKDQSTFIFNKNNIYMLSDDIENKYKNNINNYNFTKDTSIKNKVIHQFDYDWNNEKLFIHMFNKLISKKYISYFIDKTYGDNSNFALDIFCNNNIINDIKINNSLYNYICVNNKKCLEINDKILRNNLNYIMNDDICKYIEPIVPFEYLPNNVKKLIYNINLDKNINTNLLDNFDINTYIDLKNNTLFNISIIYNNKQLYDYILNKNKILNAPELKNEKFKYLCNKIDYNVNKLINSIPTAPIKIKNKPDINFIEPNNNISDCNNFYCTLRNNAISRNNIIISITVFTITLIMIIITFVLNILAYKTYKNYIKYNNRSKLDILDRSYE